MAEKKETKKEAQTVTGGARESNLMSNSVVVAALAEMDKEKDEKKKREAKEALCTAIYDNRKKRAELRKSRREADIALESLKASKELVEKLLGVECTISEDGDLIPDPKKPISKDLLITPNEFEKKWNENYDSFKKQENESVTKYREEMREVENSYEGTRTDWYVRRVGCFARSYL